MMNKNKFKVGDRVMHHAEGCYGDVTDTSLSAPHFRVEWDDGATTTESMHTVVGVDNE